VGTELRVLFEARAEDGWWTGFSDEYIRVRISSNEKLANRFAQVVLTGVELSREGVFARGQLVATESCARRVAGA
jgi:hypothetical protein